MDPKHVKNLRNEWHETTPGLPLVLYLDLPAAEVEEWMTKYCTVFAFNRRLSRALVNLIDTATADETAGLEDEASRALRLLLSFGVKWQAATAQVLEGLLNAFEELQPNRSSEPQQRAEPPRAAEALPEAAAVLEACESWLRQDGAA